MTELAVQLDLFGSPRRRRRRLDPAIRSLERAASVNADLAVIDAGRVEPEAWKRKESSCECFLAAASWWTEVAKSLRGSQLNDAIRQSRIAVNYELKGWTVMRDREAGPHILTFGQRGGGKPNAHDPRTDL